MSTELVGSLPSYDELTGTLGVTVVGGGAISFIGMIVQSTTLDTMDKVIALYGGVAWTKIEGKFLLGSSESHAVNSEGGNEDAQLPQHAHLESTFEGNTGSSPIQNVTDVSIGTKKISYATGSVQQTVVSSATVLKETVSHNHPISVVIPSADVSSVDENTTLVTDGAGANMPPYKTVYIWERTA